MSLEQAIQNLADAINNHADAIRQTGQTLLPLNEVPGTVEETTDKPAEEPKEGKSGGKGKATPAKTETPKEEAKKPAEEPKKEETEDDAPEVTLDDLRKVGTALVAEGKKLDFLAYLKEAFDAPNIGTLKSEQYPECLAGLEELLGKKLSEIAD